MPETELRMEVIALLLDADFKLRPDTNTWSHSDGRPFTQAEQATAFQATRSELEAVAALSARSAAAALEQDNAVKALTELLFSYFARHPEARMVMDVLPHMTEEDRAEYERLCAIAAPDGGIYLPYED
ncbi:hypothetical protein OG898_00485 [Streptomyces sp. NBC_00193]|uniref:hypothetical protein n=1 Tax=Streptomyces sp. NBC_00193 TaxID=2975675 RepID=UPI0022535E44|nr:hypothetical protein [Streptomyces sp. NBC_00193]MCX5294970.1 hypothetical protein [Streptomyces sp. NBC_00193]